jgi:hypothetical protein
MVVPISLENGGCSSVSARIAKSPHRAAVALSDRLRRAAVQLNSDAMGDVQAALAGSVASID